MRGFGVVFTVGGTSCGVSRPTMVERRNTSASVVGGVEFANHRMNEKAEQTAHPCSLETTANEQAILPAYGTPEAELSL